MSNYKQIRLNPEVRELLDEYKMNGESYSIAIGRLIKEREYLWESKKELSEISIKTLDLLKKKNAPLEINEDYLKALEEYSKEYEKAPSDVMEGILGQFLYNKGFLGTDEEDMMTRRPKKRK